MPDRDPGSDTGTPVAADVDPEVLFVEKGASWNWVLAGPAAALVMLVIQITSHVGVQVIVPLAFLVLVSGFVTVQVKAARIHTSVELTREYLREGTETIRVDEINKIYPAPQTSSGPGSYFERKYLGSANKEEKKELEKWQSAHALGELTGVPRGRTGIGLRLDRGRTVQAWARNHAQLRAALMEILEDRDAAKGEQ
ncbi:membrane protein [soil metagenome]